MVNEEEAKAIRRMEALRKRGLGYHTIARKLNEEGYRPRRGEWEEGMVWRILQAPATRGKVRFAGKEVKGQHEAILGKRTQDRGK